MPSVASRTGIDVWPASKSTIMLSWLGSRCCTMMKAMPLTAGSASRSFLHASRPPAEAPIATIGKSRATARGERALNPARSLRPSRMLEASRHSAIFLEERRPWERAKTNSRITGAIANYLKKRTNSPGHGASSKASLRRCGGGVREAAEINETRPKPCTKPARMSSFRGSLGG